MHRTTTAVTFTVPDSELLNLPQVVTAPGKQAEISESGLTKVQTSQLLPTEYLGEIRMCPSSSTEFVKLCVPSADSPSHSMVQMQHLPTHPYLVSVKH